MKQYAAKFSRATAVLLAGAAGGVIDTA